MTCNHRASALVVLALSACGVAIEHPLTTKVDASVNGTSDCSTSGDRVVDLTEDPDFAKYVDDVVGADIVALRFVVTDVDPANEATRATGTASVVAPDGSAIELGTYALPIAKGQVQTIAVDDAAAAKVVELALTPPHRFTIRGRASGDAYPCRFKLRAEIDLKAHVSPSALF